MPVFARYNFDDPATVLDEAPENGEQNGGYFNGAHASGGYLVLDGIDDKAKIYASDTFQLDRGTLEINFRPTAESGFSDPQTVLSRDTAGEHAGSMRIEVHGDGSISVVHEQDGETVTLSTDPGFYSPGDTINLTESWDSAGSGGVLQIENQTGGTSFSANVPNTISLAMDPNSQPWMIGAGQSHSDPWMLNNLDNHFEGQVDFFTLSDTVDNMPPDGCGNDAPVANPDFADTDEDVSATIDVLGNDTDPEGDPLTVTAASAEHGSVAINGDGTLTYTPDPDWNGTDTINYTITDTAGNESSSTVTVEVAPVNDDPEANPDAATTGAGTPVVIAPLANDTDVDGDTLSILGTPSSANGTVAVNGDGTITFTPDAGFVGTTVIDYEISDGNGGTAASTITVTVSEDGSVTCRDGLVFGTDGNDLIDHRYVDPFDGDMVDANDAIIPGDGPNDDRIFAGAGNDTVYAGAGNDTIEAGEGDDIVHGGDGDDTILGEDGNDLLYGDDGNDRMFGGAGDDTLIGGLGNDTLNGGAGNDLLRGGEGHDILSGGGGSDTLYGGVGNDILSGGGGNDKLYGGTGDDTLYGGAGNDRIEGGEGNDVAFGGAGNDRIFGGEGDDTLFGGEGDDKLWGGDGRNVVFGDEGNDTIHVTTGGDSVFGGADRDTIIIHGAEAGHDTYVDGNEDGDDFDTLDLRDAGPFEIEYDPENAENGRIHFLDGDGNHVGHLDFRNIERIVPCFTPGTLIATPRGEVPVEELSVGDRIITRDNGLQEIRWIGRNAMSGHELRANPHLQPVLIKAHSLGNGLPERDMLVSPNHRILVANDRTQLYFDEHEVLVSAKHLLGNAGVHSLEAFSVTYIHFMCDQHEVVLSNGAWTESFQPGDYSLRGLGNAQRNEIFEIFPDLKEDAEGVEAYKAARRTLKRHEARLLAR